MAKIEDKENPTTANLGKCKEIVIEGFDGDQRAVLVLALTKPLVIDGHRRTYAGLVIEQKQIAQLSRQLLRIAKRQARTISMAIPGQLVKPVRFA